MGKAARGAYERRWLFSPEFKRQQIDRVPGGVPYTSTSMVEGACVFPHETIACDPATRYTGLRRA